MLLSFVFYHIAFLGILLLLTQSLNVLWRGRMFSLGHHGFWGVGAYAAALGIRLWNGMEATSGAAGAVGYGLPLATLGLSLIIGGMVAGAAGLFLFPMLGRLRDDYFAVSTIVLAEVLSNLESNFEYLGGGLGFEMPDHVVGSTASSGLLWQSLLAIIAILLNIALFYLIRRFTHSIYGVYTDAAQDDELSVRLAGIRIGRVRHIVFAAGCAVAGVAGGLFLNLSTLIVPGDFGFIAGIPVILYVVLGRMSIRRCLWAGIILYVAYELIKLQFFGVFGPRVSNMITEVKEMLLAVVLILSVVLPVYLQQRRTAAALKPRINAGRSL